MPVPNRIPSAGAFAVTLAIAGSTKALQIKAIQRLVRIRRVPTVYTFIGQALRCGMISVVGNSRKNDGRPHRVLALTEKGKQYVDLYRKMLELGKKGECNVSKTA